MKTECPNCSLRNEIDVGGMEDCDERVVTCSGCRQKFSVMLRVDWWLETSEDFDEDLE